MFRKKEFYTPAERRRNAPPLNALSPPPPSSSSPTLLHLVYYYYPNPSKMTSKVTSKVDLICVPDAWIPFLEALGAGVSGRELAVLAVNADCTSLDDGL